MIGEIADNLSQRIEEARRIEQIVSISKQAQLLRRMPALRRRGPAKTAHSSGSLVSSIQQEVQKDYDMMVAVSTAYSKDVIQFMTMMEQFSELSLRMNQKLTFIEENIDRMMTAIGEEFESVSVVTANAEKISGKMQSLREESHVNEQIVNELEEVLSRFTV